MVALLSSCSRQPPSHKSPIGTTTDVHQGTAPEKGSEGLPRVTAEWYEVVSQQPGPEVTDRAMRRKIEESGQPWKVRDRATGLEMVLVMPGEFLMGSPASEPGRNADEGPQHRVRLTKAFYLGATEVTQALWNPWEMCLCLSLVWPSAKHVRPISMFAACANSLIPL